MTLTTEHRAAIVRVPLPVGTGSAAVREIVQEHGVLTRLMAGLQQRMGEQLRTHARQVEALEAEVLRLRVGLIVARTGLLWGLPADGAALRATRVAPPRPAVLAPARVETPPEGGDAAVRRAADSVICQTGCVGHAHPWLEADGQCRRTGSACAQVANPADESQRA